MYVCVESVVYVVFFFKQKTAYEMRISDWSSDVCSSDLLGVAASFGRGEGGGDPFGIDVRRRGHADIAVDDPILRPRARPSAHEARAEPPAVRAVPVLTRKARPGARIDVEDVKRRFLWDGHGIIQLIRSEERRVGKECVRKFRSRWSTDHYKKKK